MSEDVKTTEQPHYEVIADCDEAILRRTDQSPGHYLISVQDFQHNALASIAIKLNNFDALYTVAERMAEKAGRKLSKEALQDLRETAMALEEMDENKNLSLLLSWFDELQEEAEAFRALAAQMKNGEGK